jgi:hypothetical protein
VEGELLGAGWIPNRSSMMHRWKRGVESEISVWRRRAENESAASKWATGQEVTAMDEEGLGAPWAG